MPLQKEQDLQDHKWQDVQEKNLRECMILLILPFTILHILFLLNLQTPSEKIRRNFRK